MKQTGQKLRDRVYSWDLKESDMWRPRVEQWSPGVEGKGKGWPQGTAAVVQEEGVEGMEWAWGPPRRTPR